MAAADAARRLRLLPPGTALGWTPYAWLVYLVPFAIMPAVDGGPAEGRWGATAAATVVFLVAYFRAYWERGTRLVALVAVQAALGAAFARANRGRWCSSSTRPRSRGTSRARATRRASSSS
jgi:hypothetical protein